MAGTILINYKQRTIGSARLAWNRLTPTRGIKTTANTLGQLSLAQPVQINVNNNGLLVNGHPIYNSQHIASNLFNAGVVNFDLRQGSTPQEIRSIINTLTDKDLSLIESTLPTKEPTVRIENEPTFIGWKQVFKQSFSIKNYATSSYAGIVGGITSGFGAGAWLLFATQMPFMAILGVGFGGLIGATISYGIFHGTLNAFNYLHKALITSSDVNLINNPSKPKNIKDVKYSTLIRLSRFVQQQAKDAAINILSQRLDEIDLQDFDKDVLLAIFGTSTTISKFHADVIARYSVKFSRIEKSRIETITTEKTDGNYMHLGWEKEAIIVPYYEDIPDGHDSDLAIAILNRRQSIKDQIQILHKIKETYPELSDLIESKLASNSNTHPDIFLYLAKHSKINILALLLSNNCISQEVAIAAVKSCPKNGTKVVGYTQRLIGHVTPFGNVSNDGVTGSIDTYENVPIIEDYYFDEDIVLLASLLLKHQAQYLPAILAAVRDTNAELYQGLIK